jgi:hypothetical protein
MGDRAGDRRLNPRKAAAVPLEIRIVFRYKHRRLLR